MDVETINQLMGFSVLGMNMATLALLAVLLLRRRFPDLEDIARPVARYGIFVALALTIGGIAGTLLYEYLGFPPCPLCWYQRVFLYPQAILFAIALWRRESAVAAYSIALSAFGAAVALYNHALQVGAHSVLPCPSAIGGAQCAQRFLFEFGYVTFPFAAFSLFALLIALMLLVRRRA